MARPHARREHPFLRTLDRTVAPTLDPQGRALIRLQTLGATTLLVGDARLDPSTGTLFSLLLRLAYAPEMRCARDTLLAELWHGQTPVRQRANLRQALYKLRQLGVRAGLVGEVVELDVAQVLSTFSLERTSEQFERDVTRGHEPFGLFLPAYVASSPDFQDWLDTEREAVHADVRRVLVGQLRTRRERADWSGAEALARWLLQFDPLNEDATLTVAECTALAGSKSEAVAILDRYLAELGIGAGDIRLPAAMLRRRIAEPIARGRISFAPTERHFMGREEELSVLTMMMRRARWHDGSVVLLHGTSGMGKTRLTSELAKVGALEGFRTMRVGCRELDTMRPLSIFLDLAPAMLSMPGALGCAPENLRMLKRWMPRAFVTPEPEPEIVETSAVIEPAISELDAPSVAPPYQVVSSLRRALIDLMAAVSDEKPLLLVVDDTHWIDETSWEVLADFIEHADSTRAFVVLTSREPHARATRPGRVPNALRVRPLHPLSAESSLALARAISDDLSAPLTDALGDWFVKASEGVPLFLRSLVNHWIESGEAGGVPPTLGEVIEQRLAKLSVTALRTLQTVTLLAESATVRRLQSVLGMELHELLNAIELLERVGAIAESPAPLVTAHELIGRTASARMTKLMATALHERIAEVLSDDLVDQFTPSLVLATALHWMRSGRLERLSAFVGMHLSMLLQSGSPTIVLELIEVAAVEDSVLRADQRIPRARARLQVESGEYRVALGTGAGFVELPAVSDELADEDANAALSVVDSAYRADPYVDSETLTQFARGVAILDHLERSTRFRAAEIGLVIASNLCDAELANSCYNALGISEGDLQHDPRAMRNALLFHTVFGDRDFASTIAQQQIKAAFRAVASTHSYNDSCRAGFALRVCHSTESACDALSHGYDIAVILQLPRLAQYPAWQLAQICLDVNDHPGAEHWNDVLSKLIDSDDDDAATCFARGHFCRVAIDAGHADKAQDYLNQYARSLPRIPTVKASSYHVALQIGVNLLSPTWQPSSELIEVAALRLDRCARFCTCDFLVGVLLQAYYRAGQVDNAKQLFHRYSTELRRERTPLSSRLAATVRQLRV